MTCFTATAASIERLEDLNTFVVVLAEHIEGLGRRLEFQISIRTEDGDAEDGMDMYCMCTESGATHYGGVISWCVQSGSLNIVLDQAASRQLGLKVDTSVKLALLPETVQAVIEGLNNIFGLSAARLTSPT
jgi:Immunity protein 10